MERSSLLLLCSLCATTTTTGGTAARPPHIIFVMADDLGLLNVLQCFPFTSSNTCPVNKRPLHGVDLTLVLPKRYTLTKILYIHSLHYHYNNRQCRLQRCWLAGCNRAFAGDRRVGCRGGKARQHVHLGLVRT